MQVFLTCRNLIKVQTKAAVTIHRTFLKGNGWDYFSFQSCRRRFDSWSVQTNDIKVKLAISLIHVYNEETIGAIEISSSYKAGSHFVAAFL